MDINRRDALKIIGMTAAGSLLAVEEAEASGGAHAGEASKYAILNDGTICIGCRNCVSYCKSWYGLEDKRTQPDGTVINAKELDEDTYSYVEDRMVGDQQHFRRHMCYHCEEPSCASACPVGALRKTPDGPVIYKSELCIGCRYCMLACPFTIPRYQWDTWKPFVRKCIMCNGRIDEGMEPACTKNCPTGATKFGPREEILAEAKRRIEQNPEKYQNQIYGEHEVGGTSVFYLSTSAIPLADFGFSDKVGTESYPGFTWAALSKVPGIATFVVIWMLVTYYITHRRIPEVGKDV